MTLAMAAVGDLVAPRERGRYQGYIAATFAVATIVGPLIGGVLVDHASWRWVFLVNLPIGAAALAGLHLRLPAPEAAGADRPLDVPGAALLAGATTRPDARLHLGRCALRVGLGGDPRADRRDRRPRRRAGRARAPRGRPDRPLPPAAHAVRWPSPAPRCSSRPPRCSRSPSSCRCSCRRRPARARREAGLLLVPAMLGIAVSTTLSGRGDRAHRALQALPDRRPGADDGRARAARGLRGRPLAGRHRRSPSPCSASASAWSPRS